MDIYPLLFNNPDAHAITLLPHSLDSVKFSEFKTEYRADIS